MKFVFLTCDDLSGYVIDDDLAQKAFQEVFPKASLDVISWTDKNTDWSQYDYAVIRTTWDYTEKLEDFLSVLQKIEDSGCKLLNPLQTVQWNVQKTYLMELKKKNVPIIKSLFLGKENMKSLNKKLLDWPEEKVVLKPVVGAGAGKIQVLDKEEALDAVLDLENWSEWFIQPFIEGVFKGELSFMFFRGEFSHAVVKRPKSGDFRVQEEHGGSTELYEASFEERELAKNIVESLDKELLYARVDLMPTEEGLKLIELELVEPSFYFRLDPPSAYRFVEALQASLNLSEIPVQE